MSDSPGFDAAFFISELDKRADLRGVRVVFYNGAALNVLREGPPVCEPGLVAVLSRRGGPAQVPTSAEASQIRDQRFNAELLNLTLSCGGAAISWVVALTTTGAAPFTGGASLLVTNLSTAAGVAASVQCLNAGMRLYNERNQPEQNDWLDSQWWYESLSIAADGISLAAAGASTATTLRVVKVMRASTGKTTLEVLKGLSRQERKRLAQEVMRVRNPGAREDELEVLLKRGILTKRLANADIRKDVHKQLLDAVGATVGFTGSATGGV